MKMKFNWIPLLHLFSSAFAPNSEITDYVPVDLSAPSGSQTTKLKLYIPTRGSLSLSNPEEVYESVINSWTHVVEPHSEGLMDPKYGHLSQPGLSSAEAWHHFTAGQSGVIDSARFLISFSLVPSVQTGGSPLHIAASLGNLDKVRKLLDDGARVDETKDDGNTALHCAAIMGHVDIVELLLEEGAFIEATGDSGATPLMMAATMGHLKVTEALLKAGANPDTKHKFAKTTALHFAAEVGRTEIIEILCNHGADIEAEKSTGGTPLHTAADANMTESVRVLVEVCGADLNKLLMRDTTPLYLAAQRGFTAVVSELIRLGANVNFVMPRGQQRSDIIPVSGEQEGFYPVKNTEIGNGATALHAAVENGHLETTAVLLQSGAMQYDSMEGATPLVIALQYKHPDIALLLLQDEWDDPKINSKVPADGSSAIFVASLYGYEDVVKRLIKLKANVNIKNKGGASPLSAAINNNHKGIINLLLDAGAKLTSSSSDMSPLHTASQIGNIQLVRSIVSKQSDDSVIQTLVNAKGPDNQTPIHFAVSSGNLNLVKYLLKHGAVVNALVESTLATPLHMAALKGHHQIIETLLDAGAKVQPRAGESLHGATPLYLAAQNGHLESVRTLIRSGADINCRLRKMDVTPLFIASERGHVDIVRFLLENNASLHIRNWNGVTALGVAAMGGHKTIVNLLIKVGADVNSRDNEGNSILLKCIIQENAVENQRVIQMLLSEGADPNLKNKIKETAVVAAVKKLEIPLLEMLLMNNGEINSPIPDGDQLYTALGYVIKKQNLDVIKFLLNQGEKHCIFINGKVSELFGDCIELAIGTRNPDVINLLSDHVKDEL